jgi:signal transduction histidine kinase
LLSEEFKSLWNKVKYKTTYSVQFDTDKLIEKCAESIRDNLIAGRGKFVFKKAKAEITKGGVEAKETATSTSLVDSKYINLPDVVSYLQNETNLTRKTIVDILVKSARLDAEISNQQLLLTVLLIVLVLLGGVALFTYSYYRQKKKVAELELTVKENQLDELLQSQESKAYAAMLRGQDQERERIAQDLHDRLGGTLAALKMSLRKPGNKVGDDDMEILNDAVQEVRSIAHNLSSGVMQKYGLNQAINQLKSTIEKSGGLKFQVFLHPKISVLGQGIAIELYRVVQELVNNTIKHSGATEVSLQTNFDGETFNLIYEDNGKGFDPKKVKSGIGLENIKARVKRMNGSLHIDAEKGRGAIFIIELTKSNKA